jgi:hypothetical protein
LRVVSLLPSATEIVCALGAGGELVGISHECDHPPEAVVGLPGAERLPAVVTADSGRIDRSVRDLLRAALAIYDPDVDQLAELDPEVIVSWWWKAPLPCRQGTCISGPGCESGRSRCSPSSAGTAHCRPASSPSSSPSSAETTRRPGDD